MRIRNIIVCLSLWGCAAHAQEPPHGRAEQLLSFDRTVQDIGTLTEDDTPRKARFIYTNVSGEAVAIDRVQTTCGCTAATFSKRAMRPGERDTITLVYHPRDHVGTVDAKAFVYLTSSRGKPAASLGLTGNVLPGADEWVRYPYAMGVLRLKQSELKFNEVEPGKRPSARILCGNSGDKPLRLSAFSLPKFARLRTEPAVIKPGEEADLVVTIDETLIPPERGDSFSFAVMLNGIDIRPSERTFTVHVERVAKKYPTQRK